MEIYENTSYLINSLEDLTGNVADRDKQVSHEWISALETSFAGTEVTTELVRPSSESQESDRRFALIPKTKIVLKIAPAMINAVKAIAKGWSAYHLQQNGLNIEAGAAFATALESLGKIRTAVECLDADGGEVCSYVTTIDAAVGVPRIIGCYPTRPEMWEAHQTYQVTCNRTSCKNFSVDRCHITHGQWDDIISDLNKRGILVNHKEGRLWPAL